MIPPWAGLFLVLFILTPALFAQQPQAQSGQAIFAVNAKYVQGVGPGYWPTAGTALSSPSAPALSQAAGGTIAATTYFAKITYVNVAGETLVSAESSFAVSANNLLVITSPAATSAANGNATGWKPYVSTATGTETLQAVSGNCTLNSAGTACAIGSNWTEPTGGLVTGAAVPGSNTTALYANLTAGTALCGNPPVAVLSPTTDIALTASATSYVYLDPAATCVAAKSTSGFSVGQIPVAKAVTGATTVTAITDYRTWSTPVPCAMSSAGATRCQSLGTNQNFTLDASGTGILITNTTTGLQLHNSSIGEFAVDDFELTSNYNQLTNTLYNTAKSSWDMGLGVAADEFLVERAPATGGAAVFVPMFTITSNGYGTIKALNKVRFADQYAGGSADAKITACIADLPTTGGICDARGLEGNQTISASVTLGSSTKTVVLLLGNGIYASSVAGAAFIVPAGTTGDEILGVGSGSGTVGTVIQVNNSAGLGIDIQGTNASPSQHFVARDLMLNGPGSATTAIGLQGSYAHYLHLSNVRISSFNKGTNISNSLDILLNVRQSFNNTSIISGASNPTTILGGEAGSPVTTGWEISSVSGLFIYGTLFEADATNASTLLWLKGVSKADVDAYFEANAANQTAVKLDTDGTIRCESDHIAGRFQGNSKSTVTAINVINANRTTIDASWIHNWTTGINISASTGARTQIAPGLDFLGNTTDVSDSGTTTYDLRMPDAGGWNISAAGVVDIKNSAGLKASAGPITAAKALIAGFNTVTFSATPTFDASLGNTQKITLTANVTSSTLSNATQGEAINFIICQDATGSRTFVWPTNVLGVMTIGATASKCSAQTFIFDGTNAYALSSGVANM